MLKIKEGFKGERLISLPLFAIEKFKKDELGKELYLTNIFQMPNIIIAGEKQLILPTIFLSIA